MPTQLTIGTINIAGLSSTKSQWRKKGVLHSPTVDIMAIQETNCKIGEEEKWTERYQPHQSTWTQHCGLILKNNTQTKLLAYNTHLGGRLLTAHIDWNNHPIHIAVVYAPAKNQERIPFLEQLNQTELHPETIYMGDFNCWTNRNTDRWPRTINPPEGASQLTFLKQTKGLTDALPIGAPLIPNMSRPHMVQGEIISFTRIDLILTPYNLDLRTSNFRTSYVPQSDHRMITLMLTHPKTTNPRPRWNKLLPRDARFPALQKKVLI